MPVQFNFNTSSLRAWLLLHQTYNLVVRSEDMAFSRLDLTTQQHSVLMAIKFLTDPVTPKDVANWLDRNQNGVSMILNRMEKDGLVRKIRDLSDRRLVRLVITEKGSAVQEEATVLGWHAMTSILSDLSEDELGTLITMLEKIRGKAFLYINSKEGLGKVEIPNESRNMQHFMTRVSTYTDHDTRGN